jgi:hypothetical protein
MRINRFSAEFGCQRPVSPVPAGAFKFLGDELLVRKDSPILRREHFVGKIVECIVGL